MKFNWPILILGPN